MEREYRSYVLIFTADPRGYDTLKEQLDVLKNLTLVGDYVFRIGRRNYSIEEIGRLLD